MTAKDLAVSLAPFLNMVFTIPINFCINKFWEYKQKRCEFMRGDEWMYFNINSVIEGMYQPGSFILEMDKRLYESEECSQFSKEEMATLTHEYVHYLQDCSTVNGILQFQNTAKMLQFNIAIAQRQEKVHLPIDLEQYESQNAYIKSELMSFYEGDRLEKKIHHINKIQLEEEELIKEILEKNSDYKDVKSTKVKIYYDDNCNPTTFGNKYVMESMAYLIERYCFEAEERKREFPYNACEMLCKEVYPDLLENPECMALLCELSLMYEDSGNSFYNLLVHLKNKNLGSLKYDEMKKYLTKMMKNRCAELKNIQKSITEDINRMFPPNMPNMGVVNVYVSSIYEFGIERRSKELFFISDIFMCKNPVEKLKEWILSLPRPIYKDIKSEVQYGELNQLSMMQVPVAIFKYFRVPNKGCELIDFCKHSKLENVDDVECKQKPWVQCKKDTLCPLALYLWFFGLDTKKFEVDIKCC